MIIKNIAKLSILPLILYSVISFGNGSFISPIGYEQAFYLGAIGGYGSTTWRGLVPTKRNQNSALNISTPIKVTEGGGVWGFLGGFEFMPAFAVELNYLNFPQAQVFFDEVSLFAVENDDLVRLDTRTDMVSLMGKLMLPIINPCLRIFSGAGVAAIHRKDIIVDYWHLSPSFGVGLNYRLGRHLMAEINGNYTAGFGESQLSPTNSYFPFLYSVTGRLSYRF